MPGNKSYSTLPQEDLEQSAAPKHIPLYKNKLCWLAGTTLFGFTCTFILGAVLLCRERSDSVPKRNVIMMISDGFGPASETFARQYYTWSGHRGYKTMLPLDQIHIGQSRTQSSSSLITDSAAGATAFSCGKKSYNGAIGVDPEEYPCGTVLESAKLQRNMLTGLVVTSRITHATPAAFSAHVGSRDWENIIAEQQIGYNPLGRTLDLMFGGGACEFTHNTSAGSCRFDDRDLFREAQEKFNWHIALSKQEYDAIQPEKAQLPLMALFSPSHMSFEIDRDPKKEPALHEMVDKALKILKIKSDQEEVGFFLMIEGSRIDMAAHNNDPAAHLRDIFEYQETVALVKQFVKDNPNTVLISTSDHETGGFTAGRQVGEDYPEYLWYPEVISRVKNSTEVLAIAWNDAVEKGLHHRQDFLRRVLIQSGLGIDDITEEEIQKVNDWRSTEKSVEELSWIFSDMVSRRALIGWSTHGHTAVDVNLYAYGEGTSLLRGSHENTEIGDFITRYLHLDLDEVTDKLVAKTNGSSVNEMRISTILRDNKYHG